MGWSSCSGTGALTGRYVPGPIALFLQMDHANRADRPKTAKTTAPTNTPTRC